MTCLATSPATIAVNPVPPANSTTSLSLNQINLFVMKYYKLRRSVDLKRGGSTFIDT